MIMITMIIFWDSLVGDWGSAIIITTISIMFISMTINIMLINMTTNAITILAAIFVSISS